MWAHPRAAAGSPAEHLPQRSPANLQTMPQSHVAYSCGRPTHRPKSSAGGRSHAQADSVEREAELEAARLRATAEAETAAKAAVDLEVKLAHTAFRTPHGILHPSHPTGHTPWGPTPPGGARSDGGSALSGVPHPSHPMCWGGGVTWGGKGGVGGSMSLWKIRSTFWHYLRWLEELHFKLYKDSKHQTLF